MSGKYVTQSVPDSFCSSFYLEKTGIESLICLCLIADVSFTRALKFFFSLGSLCKRIYLQERRHWTLICLCFIASAFFFSRYKFISNTFLLPPWVSVFTWRNGDTGALICLCLIASVFFSRYQFISNTLLLPNWVSVFTWRNGDTGAFICLCLIASVYFYSRVMSSFRILFGCLLG